MSEAEFKSRFALDHEELVQGGKVILQGGGELGAVLFQAGGGLKNLLDVQHELDRELEALFKPGGSKPRINAGLAELRARPGYPAKRRRCAATNGSSTSRRARTHGRASGRSSCAGDASGLQSAGSSGSRRPSPCWSGSNARSRSWASSGRSRCSPTDSRRRRRGARPARGLALHAGAGLGAIVRLDREIAETAVPEELLAESEAIEGLRDGLGADRKARKALPGEEAKFLQALASVQDLLGELQPGRPAEGRGEPALVSASAPPSRR